MHITDDDLEPLNRQFATATPEAILRFAHSTFGTRSALLSSMQRAGTALCHMAESAGLDWDVLFVDTGVLHTQTLRTRDRLAETHRRLRVVTLAPAQSFEAQTRDLGLLYLTREGQERCCELRKSAPLESVKGQYDALINALRRDEGGARSKVRPFGLDPGMNALRVHPLASLTRDGLDAYVAAHGDVVVNPLHAMGFPTIGCFPCTTPVRADEPERAGRWRHLANVDYCGINPIDRGSAAASVELVREYPELRSAR